MLLSIDVGIRNLGMCLMDTETKQIHEWEVGGVPPAHQDGVFNAMAKHLSEKPWIQKATLALIERQPPKNRTMKALEHFLHGYLLALGVPVRLWDAKHKIPDICGPGKAQYTKRKKASIDRCATFLQDSCNTRWISVFNSSLKKDDMADTVMQALSYNGPLEITKTQKKETKSRPRKPTLNQKETKYSKANLAWIYLHGTMDKRFHKDLGRYYHSLEEMKKEFSI